MGMDQYFYAKVSVDPDSRNAEEVSFTSAFSDKRFTLGMSGVCAVVYFIGYLRKCYGVHNWLTEGKRVGNCEEIELDKYRIIELKEDVKTALNDAKFADEVFDVKISNEWDLQGLKETLAIIERAEEYMELYNAEIYYSASW